ncbi:hypothetical protein, partial [Pseudomonas sp. Sample_9]|uniref:hypothetical protein n=1 Tax=Pseudomonas sp. Sample_9 TaxID=2382158 RepID=UPI0019D5B24B
MWWGIGDLQRTNDPVGAAEGCDLLILILILKSMIKSSQPSAAPTGNGSAQPLEHLVIPHPRRQQRIAQQVA